MAKSQDYNRQFTGIIELVEDKGKRQLAELMQGKSSRAKVPGQGYWRVEPDRDERKAGAVIYLYPPDSPEDFIRTRMPVKGCTADTIKVLKNNLARRNFDTEQEEKDREYELREAQKRRDAEVAAHEQQRRSALAAKKPSSKPALKQIEKRWPKRETVTQDIDHVQAKNQLDDRGDGSLKPRPISEANVRRIIKIIKTKMWISSDVHVNWYNYMQNGRHRYEAVRRIGTLPEHAEWVEENTGTEHWPVRFHVIYGCDPKETYDSPRTRTAGDELVMHDLVPDGVNQDNLSAGLKFLAGFKSSGSVGTGAWNRERFENSLIPVLIERFPGIFIAVEQAKVLHPGKRKPGVVSFAPSVAIAFCYLVAEAFPDCGSYLDLFMPSVTLGANLDEKDPRFALRNIMLGSPIPAQKQMALLIKMWNYWLTQKPAEVATWRKGEQMPLPVTEDRVTLRL